MRKIFAWLIGCSLALWLVPASFGQWISPNIANPINPTVPMVFIQEQEYRVQLIGDMITDYNRRLDSVTQKEIIHEIMDASENTDLDPFLIAAVIAAESSFRPRAVSPCGARGLMQLTRIVQPSLGVTNPFDIAQNIRGGCTFLAELQQRFGDTTLALAAYNAGPTRVARLKRVPRIRETQRYVVKVQRIAAFLYEQLLNGVNAYRQNPVSFINELPQHQTTEILQDRTGHYRQASEPSLTSAPNLSTHNSQTECINGTSFFAYLPVQSDGYRLFRSALPTAGLRGPIILNAHSLLTLI